MRHDRDGHEIPLRYARNSLAVRVQIRRVDEVREICMIPKANKILEDVWYDLKYQHLERPQIVTSMVERNSRQKSSHIEQRYYCCLKKRNRNT